MLGFAKKRKNGDPPICKIGRVLWRCGNKASRPRGGEGRVCPRGPAPDVDGPLNASPMLAMGLAGRRPWPTTTPWQIVLLPNANANCLVATTYPLYSIAVQTTG